MCTISNGVRVDMSDVMNLLEVTTTKDEMMHIGTIDQTKVYPLRKIRNQVFKLSTAITTLSNHFTDISEDDESDRNRKHIDESHDQNVTSAMISVLQNVIRLSDLLCINLFLAVEGKMELNRRKYPVQLCKGRAGKYTEYSTVTGITKESGQDTSSAIMGHTESCSGLFLNQLHDLTNRIRQFAVDREWQVYHQPRNLLLALIGELGELAELVQFKGDDATCLLSYKEIEKLGQEIADVTIYLLRLADVCNIELHVASLTTSV